MSMFMLDAEVIQVNGPYIAYLPQKEKDYPKEHFTLQV